MKLLFLLIACLHLNGFTQQAASPKKVVIKKVKKETATEIFPMNIFTHFINN